MDMRKINNKVRVCVNYHHEFKEGNTLGRFLYNDGDDNYRYDVALHGNTIFHIGRRDGVYNYVFSTCGWDTNVTAARLNACARGIYLPVEFKIRNGQMHWFKDGKDMGAFDSLTNEQVEVA